MGWKMSNGDNLEFNTQKACGFEVGNVAYLYQIYKGEFRTIEVRVNKITYLESENNDARHYFIEYISKNNGRPGYWVFDTYFTPSGEHLEDITDYTQYFAGVLFPKPNEFDALNILLEDQMRKYKKYEKTLLKRKQIVLMLQEKINNTLKTEKNILEEEQR